MKTDTPVQSFGLTGEATALLSILNKKKEWISNSEGMEYNEISLGALEDGLYFKGKEKGVFFLSKT